MRMQVVRRSAGIFIVSLGLLGACGGDDEDASECTVGDNATCENGTVCKENESGTAQCVSCTVGADSACGEDMVCEEVVGGDPQCFAPIALKGHVFDVTDDSAIEGATLVAQDVNGVAVSEVAVTDAEGNYELQVPVPRDSDGTPQSTSYTLRADAQGYLTFPKAPRTALPIDVANAADGVVMSTATDVGLIPLDSTEGLGIVKGTVLADAPGGTLVVSGGVTALADHDGDYTLFNVPAGDALVQGFLRGVNLQSADAVVGDGETVTGVDLAVLDSPTHQVSGKVEIVNPGDGTDTSVILVVESTFDPDAIRGEAPPGLRVGDVSGEWNIDGVPDGSYVVLAAFENDFLVRDPDTSIGGTQIVTIEVNGSDVVLDESFKITGSLEVESPDKEQVVSGSPTFVFADDSGEDHYEIRVFDALGEMIWEKTDVPGVSGSATVEVPYEGPALESGMLYQFRAVSIKQGGTPLATTEDLRGVFQFE